MTAPDGRAVEGVARSHNILITTNRHTCSTAIIESQNHQKQIKSIIRSISTARYQRHQISPLRRLVMMSISDKKTETARTWRGYPTSTSQVNVVAGKVDQTGLHGGEKKSHHTSV